MAKATAKKKWVAFKSNATIPMAILGEKEDRKVQVGEVIEVPATYADHVVQDGFAEFSDALTAATTKKQPKVDVDAKGKIQKLEKDLKATQGALKTSEDEVADLKVKLQESVDAVTSLTSELSDANDALASTISAAKSPEVVDAEARVADAQAALDAVGLGKPAGPEIAALQSAQQALAELQS